MSENLMPHIRLPKDLDVDCALLPGDPARADAVATHLEDAELLASNREFRSWRGTYKGKKVLVTSFLSDCCNYHITNLFFVNLILL